MSDVYGKDQPRMPGDVPLPGFYEVITVQCNVTLSPQSGRVKWVGIVRDPMTQVELERFHGAYTDATSGYLGALKGITNTMAAAWYCGGYDFTSRASEES